MTKPLLVGNKWPVASPEDAADIREPQLTKNIELGLVRSLNSLSSFVLFLFNSLARILILSHLSLTLSRILPLSHSFSKLLLPKKRLIGELEGSNYCRGGGRIKFFLLKRSKQKKRREFVLLWEAAIDSVGRNFDAFEFLKTRLRICSRGDSETWDEIMSISKFKTRLKMAYFILFCFFIFFFLSKPGLV